jgi:hypothetical protein
MRRDSDLEGDYKNALPSEVAGARDSDMPRELHTQADNEPPLSRPEADVAGISLTPEVVYADSDEDPNRDDERDAHQAGPDEHL